ncbi:MAG: aminotransferase class I/II-fold pyridoxal phosphate-dependent enzyme [Planctomycetota bacterium]|nr:MAG: aminotransferase class I/II-fold pyridoxal phosphate-dependent enzyme [Planctomycetota bacterium]
MTADKQNFISDTVTRPTEAMYKAMAESPVGDDVHGADPTVNRLEELAAEKVGKEAALYVPSGIMGNLLALGTHGSGGGEVIAEALCHIHNFEGGGCSRVWGLHVRTVLGERGAMDPDDVKAAVRKRTTHTGETKVILIENTHNFHGGAIIPLENIKAIRRISLENNARLHIDGARMMNACVATGIKPSEYAAQADSVMFCLSKGLSAPVGSMLTGSADFIAEARVTRRMIGGGMRQVGVIAAAGIVALTEMVDRLADDHANAKKLAEGLAEIDSVIIDPKDVETNIIIFRLKEGFPPYGEVVQNLKNNGLLISSMADKVLRMVTHKDVDAEDVDKALAILRNSLPEMQR